MGDSGYITASLPTVAAVCGRNEEALATLNRIAREPVSFVHLSKLRWGPDGIIRALIRAFKLITDAEAEVKCTAEQMSAPLLPNSSFILPTFRYLPGTP